jgi:hypothetical protein
MWRLFFPRNIEAPRPRPAPRQGQQGAEGRAEEGEDGFQARGGGQAPVQGTPGTDTDMRMECWAASLDWKLAILHWFVPPALREAARKNGQISEKQTMDAVGGATAERR